MEEEMRENLSRLKCCHMEVEEEQYEWKPNLESDTIPLPTRVEGAKLVFTAWDIFPLTANKRWSIYIPFETMTELHVGTSQEWCVLINRDEQTQNITHVLKFKRNGEHYLYTWENFIKETWQSCSKIQNVITGENKVPETKVDDRLMKEKNYIVSVKS